MLKWCRGKSMRPVCPIMLSSFKYCNSSYEHPIDSISSSVILTKDENVNTITVNVHTIILSRIIWLNIDNLDFMVLDKHNYVTLFLFFVFVFLLPKTI